MARKKNKKEKEDMIRIEGEDEIKTAAEEETEVVPKEPTEETEASEPEDVQEEAGESPEAEPEEADEKVSSEETKESEGEPEEEPESGKKPKKFGRKKDKRDEQIAELQDKVTRQMAEFDNFRKRSEKEKAAMYSMGARDVLEKMLEVLDNFERGFDAVEEDDQDDAFVQGMQMVYKQMLEALEKLGVKPIEAVGQPFDPNYHNAVMHEDNEEAGENEVVAEFQKGYMYHDDVIRHSMVKVAN
ncbi:MAG: nucleotide exchange factor GrpE [Lachnospiraceae bacterium]|nr:nucleotide exchange factor GrpE [Lachnospiraceae bacterium]